MLVSIYLFSLGLENVFILFTGSIDYLYSAWADLLLLLLLFILFTLLSISVLSFF